MVSIHGRQTKIAELDEAASPGHKARIAGPKGQVGSAASKGTVVHERSAKPFVVVVPFMSTVFVKVLNDLLRVGIIGVHNRKLTIIRRNAELADLKKPRLFTIGQRVNQTFEKTETLEFLQELVNHKGVLLGCRCLLSLAAGLPPSEDDARGRPLCTVPDGAVLICRGGLGGSLVFWNRHVSAVS